MPKVVYQTFPTSNPSLPAEVVDLFQRMRLDMAQLLAKISNDAQSNSEIDMNGAIEEAYIRALVVAGVLMPLPDGAPMLTDTSNHIH